MQQDLQKVAARQLALLQIPASTAPNPIVPAHREELGVLAHKHSVLASLNQLDVDYLGQFCDKVREDALGEEKTESFELLDLEGLLVLSRFHLKLLALGEEALRAVDHVLEGYHIILLAGLNALDEGVEGFVDGG